MFQRIFIGLLFFPVLFVSCSTSRKNEKAVATKGQVNTALDHSAIMLQYLLRAADKNFDDKECFPRTINSNSGVMISTNIYDWTSGFFPGLLWYNYEYFKNDSLKNEAIKWTEKLKPLEHYTNTHDLGFMLYCSYGNAYRITNNELYKAVLVNGAKALCTRFNAKVGCIRSWNSFTSWHKEARQYYFPVIIDNMMNLEMLYSASKVTGDTTYSHIATTHALTTMQNHFRPNYSSYHVVLYDTATGNVITKETGQGYADNSTWARGQSWAIYGFTMCYRETKDSRFLKTAVGLADYFIHNNNLPADNVPYWDFNANEPGYIPGERSYANKVADKYRDVSAAAITASALLELSNYTDGEKGKTFKEAAEKILHALGSKTYTSDPGSNGNFILKHSVGSIPHETEIDVPLIYADYYYVEALLRYDNLLKNKPVLSAH